MAYVHCTLKSAELGMNTDINVILPEDAGVGPKRARYPALYLLHGASDNYSNWLRSTAVERYATERGLAVVMPSAALSFYNDMKYGQNYYSYISSELPNFVKTMFPVLDGRENTFVAGLSMGGYGALRIGLSKPENYSAIACFSGAVDLGAFPQLNAKMEAMAKMLMQDPEVGDIRVQPFDMLVKTIFGDEPIIGTDKDPAWLAGNILDNKKPVPYLYITCGTDDFLYEMNINFRANLERTCFPFEYEEWKGGHEWPFWDESIRKFINRLPIGGIKAKGDNR